MFVYFIVSTTSRTTKSDDNQPTLKLMHCFRVTDIYYNHLLTFADDQRNRVVNARMFSITVN